MRNLLKNMGIVCGSVQFLTMFAGGILYIIYLIYSWIRYHGNDTVPFFTLIFTLIVTCFVAVLVAADIVLGGMFIRFVKKGSNRLQMLFLGAGLLVNLLFSVLVAICGYPSMNAVTGIYCLIAGILFVISALCLIAGMKNPER